MYDRVTHRCWYQRPLCLQKQTPVSRPCISCVSRALFLFSPSFPSLDPSAIPIIGPSEQETGTRGHCTLSGYSVATNMDFRHLELVLRHCLLFTACQFVAWFLNLTGRDRFMTNKARESVETALRTSEEGGGAYL